ncbi:MFS transporter [Maritalea porphyrae]|uniref:MFS transporter n=1 Tax=Maritalea porphyrae TaxID=880732 RepID=UPI0022AF49EE|nr:MFS transporter [Maritalea porphyrae]MCZ4272679.1 MFS transporter [Maritalea porphyrae]
MYKLLAIMAVAAVTASLDLISIFTFAGYVLQADAKGVAFIAVAMFLPLSILGKYYARLVARYSARDLMLFSLVVRALATGMMFWVNDLAMLLVLVTLRSAAIGLFYPTIAALAERYREHGKFAAWTNLTNSGARIAAPLVGGVLGVVIGEKFVFVVSAVACILVLPLVVMGRFGGVERSSQAANAKPETTSARVGLKTWLLMGVPIVGVSGLSVMMSNLMPYTLNLFEVPKILLSVALSLSAATGLLVNLAFVRWGKKPSGFPSGMIALSWFGVVVGFLGLALAVPSPFSIYMIPLMFMLLTLSKTSFTVSIMGYVFQQPKERAARLAAFDQSLGSMAGMLTTLLGAFSLTSASPIPMMYVAVTIGAGACLVWWLTVGLAERRTAIAGRV